MNNKELTELYHEQFNRIKELEAELKIWHDRAHMAEVKVMSREQIIEQLSETELAKDVAKAEAENAALKKENERLREFARWVGDNYHVTDWPFASINANAVREKLDVLLTGGE